MQVIDTTGRHRAIDWITGTDGDLNGMVTDISVFGATEVFGRRAGGKLGRLLLGAGHDGLGLFGTGNDRNRRNRLETRALCRSLADVIAQAQVRQTKLPLAQSFLASGDFALMGNCPVTTGGLGIAPQDALGLIQVAQSPAEIEQLQQWFRELWRQADPDGDAVVRLRDALADGQAQHPAGAVYLQSLFQLFTEMEEATNEDRIVDPATGIRAAGSGLASRTISPSWASSRGTAVTGLQPLAASARSSQLPPRERYRLGQATTCSATSWIS